MHDQEDQLDNVELIEEVRAGQHPRGFGRAEPRTLSDDGLVVRRRRGRRLDGWAIDRSNSGLRAVLDGCVRPDEELSIEIGHEPCRSARVAWVQLGAGGVIVGLEWLVASGARAQRAG